MYVFKERYMVVIIGAESSIEEFVVLINVVDRNVFLHQLPCIRTWYVFMMDCSSY